MRRKFISCWSRQRALEECPWASRVMKVVDGYICFESISDYEIALNQK